MPGLIASQLQFPFGEGVVTCSASDGSVIRVEHPHHPDMSFLLTDNEGSWHHAPFFWGKGFIITDHGSGQWEAPQKLEQLPDGLDLVYEPLPGLQLQVARRFGSRWSETYCLINSNSQPITVRSWGISLPFRDIYPSAQECLEGACNVHIWTGGSYAYVWAIRMNGEGPGLGLALQRGELWSYSIETRNYFTGSNVRGHIYIQATDAGRSPEAMGGQPEIVLPPGESYELAWKIGWFADFETFEREALVPPLNVPSLAAEVGEALELHSKLSEPVTLKGMEEVNIKKTGAGTFDVTSPTPGVKHLDVSWSEGRSRVAVLFHPPLREIVEKRIEFILAHQRAADRAPDRRGAFLPYDTQWGLRVNAGDWSDWSDGRERLAMPLLLVLARQRGWGPAADSDAALADFDRYAQEHLLDEYGSVMEDSYHRTPKRLYNFPWLAQFYVELYRLHHRRTDLLRAAQIMERYYALGSNHFLAFLGECVPVILAELEAAGETGRAARLKALVLNHADYFVSLGTDLPKHEVNYEQTVVAPLVQLLETAYRIQPEPRYASALQERLPWLLAFAGQQPHVRLRHIPIRHWDGYWFGRYRLWGDVMPHYWSVQSAAALLNWPEKLDGAPPNAPEMARAILDANLAHFREDGAATCAFIFPSCVNGNPAYTDDPLANDQDWALVYYLHYIQQGGIKP